MVQLQFHFFRFPHEQCMIRARLDIPDIAAYKRLYHKLDNAKGHSEIFVLIKMIQHSTIWFYLATYLKFICN